MRGFLSGKDKTYIMKINMYLVFIYHKNDKQTTLFFYIIMIFKFLFFERVSWEGWREIHSGNWHHCFEGSND